MCIRDSCEGYIVKANVASDIIKMHEQTESATTESIVDKGAGIKIYPALFLGETYESADTALCTATVKGYVVEFCESLSDHQYRVLPTRAGAFAECAVREVHAGVS